MLTLDTSENECAGHERQSLALSLPDVSRYLPAMQSLQWLEALMVEYFPAGQSSQYLEALMVEYFPAGQSSHNPLPFVGLYLPATHAMQNEGAGVCKMYWADVS